MGQWGVDGGGGFISDEGNTGIDESDTEAAMLCAKFKMHNGRNKSKEEHIKTLAHSLTADADQL